jgi:hypothetical protein
MAPVARREGARHHALGATNVELFNAEALLDNFGY